ncbi:MAG: hypothetical protein ABFR36_06045 [Acidobacteriota bacterium]
MIKKIALFVVMLVLVFGVNAPAKAYEDAEPVINKMLLSIEKFIGGLEKADTAPAIVSAINEYTKNIKTIAPLFKVILKKYPELEDEKTHPEVLKPQLMKMDATIKKLMVLYGKITKHMGNPEVKKALDEMTKASAAMDKEEEKEGEEK